MKANELRSGNIYQENGKYYRANGSDIINLERMEKTGKVCDMQPVVLTAEILLKCGLCKKTKLSGHLGFYLNGWWLIPNNGQYDFMSDGSSIILCRIIHLHQLQNLILDLTGEELEINL